MVHFEVLSELLEISGKRVLEHANLGRVFFGGAWGQNPSDYPLSFPRLQDMLTGEAVILAVRLCLEIALGTRLLTNRIPELCIASENQRLKCRRINHIQ